MSLLLLLLGWLLDCPLLPYLLLFAKRAVALELARVVAVAAALVAAWLRLHTPT